jgi:hypothetical protein
VAVKRVIPPRDKMDRDASILDSSNSVPIEFNDTASQNKPLDCNSSTDLKSSSMKAQRKNSIGHIFDAGDDLDHDVEAAVPVHVPTLRNASIDNSIADSVTVMSSKYGSQEQESASGVSVKWMSLFGYKASGKSYDQLKQEVSAAFRVRYYFNFLLMIPTHIVSTMLSIIHRSILFSSLLK